MATLVDYRGLIRQSSIILFIILALYLALIRPLVKQGANILHSQIEDAAIQLERYIPRKEGEFLPTKKILAGLEAALAQEEQNYQDLINFIDPKGDYLAEGTEEAGLYFIEQLHITAKRLKRQANTLKIRIPDSFGFSEEMPRDAENVELLLKELDIVDRVTTMLLEQGVKQISLIKPLTPIEQRDQESEELFYRELPIQLSFLCNSSTLIKFLYQMKNFSPVLIVKDIIIKRKEGQSLQVEVLLSRLVVS